MGKLEKPGETSKKPVKDAIHEQDDGEDDEVQTSKLPSSLKEKKPVVKEVPPVKIPV